MRRARVLKLALLLAVLLAIAAPAFAQWTTPTIDGSIGNRRIRQPTTPCRTPATPAKPGT